MKRVVSAARPNWQSRVESYGLVWHTAAGQPYWNESAHYSFTMAEIESIETATHTLYEMFLAAGQAIIDDRKIMKTFGIPDFCHDAIQDAWNSEPPALNYGRFDFGFTGDGPPKLFEFNCDTPTSLLEASVIQWDWKEEVYPKLDQFNSIHEKLIGKWKDIRSYLTRPVHFTHVADDAGEDSITVAYLRDTAREAGIESIDIVIDDIGWNSLTRNFVDLEENPIRTLYHLYPWEWLVNEAYGEKIISSLDRTLWIEPIWKMIWSNKAILPILSSMYPDHDNLLEASYSPLDCDHVRKPLLAREGANIDIVRHGSTVATSSGDYGEEGFVYQALYPLREFAPGSFPVLGSWIIDGAPAGMGIREDGLITGNLARFVPHVIEG